MPWPFKSAFLTLHILFFIYMGLEDHLGNLDGGSKLRCEVQYCLRLCSERTGPDHFGVPGTSK